MTVLDLINELLEFASISNRGLHTEVLLQVEDQDAPEGYIETATIDTSRYSNPMLGQPDEIRIRGYGPWAM